jgi:hypothetical protein
VFDVIVAFINALPKIILIAVSAFAMWNIGRAATGAPVGSGHFETRYSKRGYPIQMWVRDMPRLDESYLKCVVYLYPTEDAAEKGELA